MQTTPHVAISWFKDAFSVLKKSFLSWQQHRCSAWSAALAFYSVVSIGPFLIGLYLLGILLFGREKVIAEIVPKVQDRLGPRGVDFLAYLTDQFSGQIRLRGGMAVFGIAAMAWGAALYFRHLSEALEIVWGYPDAKPGFIEALRQKIRGTLLALLHIQVFLASLWVRVEFDIPSNAPETPTRFLIGSGDMLVFFLLQALFAFLLYRFFIPERAPWRILVPGTLVTAAFQTAARLVGAHVLTQGDLTSLGGLAGGFVVLLVWVNFMNQVFLYGAEITHQLMIRRWHQP